MTVYDLNSRDSCQNGHVPGAIHLDHATFKGEELPVEKNEALVFYCSNPMFRKAANAAKLSQKLGYTNLTKI